MAGFNPMATPAGGDALGLNVHPSGTPLGMEVFDGDLNFDESLLDDVHGLPNMPFTPSYDFEPFSATFEDPFSYSSRPNFPGIPANSASTAAAAAGATAAAVTAGPSHGGVHVHHHRATAEADAGFADPESSPRDGELDNKLLSFSAPVAKVTLVDEAGQPVEVAMTAELYGMFFVAEDVFGSDNGAAGRPLELTCYRRNLWQCSGHIALPRHPTYVVLPPEQGSVRAPLLELAASITAVESIEGKPTEIISIPWKSANPAGGSEEHHHKTAAAPPRIPIDFSSGSNGQELDGSHLLSVPVLWKRLQFKHATANNGRRKGLQQHYIVQISLLGRLGQPQQQQQQQQQQQIGGTGAFVPSADGFVKIAEIQSGPVIVRGRSPRNFDSRKDVQLISDKKLERRSMSNDAGLGSAGAVASAKSEQGVKGDGQGYQLQGNSQNGDWTYNGNSGSTGPPPPKRVATSPSLNRPPVPAWSSSSESLKHQAPPPTKAAPSLQRPTAPPTLPINLSLSEDERTPPNRSSADSLSSPQLARGRTSSAQNPSGSPVESADLLYEYFPLSLDDFFEPVDAVYRPHVVHHIRTVEVNPQQIRSKTKRYFVPD